MSVRDYSEKVKFKDIIIGEELSLREYQAELFRYFFDNSKTIELIFVFKFLYLAILY